MGKINVNKAISKITGDSPINTVAVKKLFLLIKGKQAGKIGGVKCRNDSDADEEAVCSSDGKNIHD